MRSVLFIAILLISTTVLAQKEAYMPPKFQNLSLTDGLSNLHVTSICQDDLGYIFIGTARGLNRYDGRTFKHYFIDSENSTLRHNAIQLLHKTQNNKIICATSRGLNIYDPVKDKLSLLKSQQNFNSFTNYKKETYGSSATGGVFKFDSTTYEMLPVTEFKNSATVNALLGDDNTGIWGKSVDNTFLFNYNAETKQIEKYPISSEKNYSDAGDLVRIENYIIIASHMHIRFFDIKKRQLIKTPLQYAKLKLISNSDITFIKEVENDVLWIGTKGNGLYIFDVLRNKMIHYAKNKLDGKVISDYFSCIYRDDKENIWLGSFDSGVEIAFDKRKNFDYDLELNSFSKNEFINAIESTNDGLYFLGTRFNGIYVYNSKTRKHKVLDPQGKLSDEKNIRTLKLDSENKLWISSDKSLFIYDLNGNNFERLEIPDPNKGIVCFCESEGRMLAGSDKQGLIVYDLKGNILKQIKDMGPNITQILSTSNNEYVVSSYGLRKGLFKYNILNDSITNLNNRINLPKEMLSEIVTCYFDSDSILWIGNFNYGLFRLDLNLDSITVFSKKYGLPSNDITGIVEDSDGLLWISTAYGLAQFDKKSEIINYFYNEGLENIQFHQKATHKDQYGTIFFGGNFGVTYFNPTNFGLNKKESPNVILKTLRVSNVEVQPGDGLKILENRLSYTSAIRLTHDYTVFTIEYHAFDYAAANNIKYAYILEGFHNKWNFVEDKNFASFSNLRPGTYTFKVKAKNNNGIWSDPIALQIEIVAPPWKTKWAFLGYFLFILLSTYVVFRLILNARLYKKNLDFAHKERLREKEMSKMKLQFFTNISHEIRTPLTLIKGNVDFLEKELRDKEVQVSSMSSLKNSTNRLLRLVNQILSFRKLENDALDLSVDERDIIKVSNELLDSFKYTASLRKINIVLNSEFSELIIPFDLDKYEKILSNLISNALKFSKEKGTIRLNISVLDEMQCGKYFAGKKPGNRFIEVAICDNGKGINENLLPNIFDRFANTESETTDFSGTGIGLNFTKRLIELHQGYINVNSKENVETCFSFILPIDKETYTGNFMVKSEKNYIPEPQKINPIADNEINLDKKQRTILLVEDDLELNKFIVTAISDKYNVISAYDGKEGLAIAKDKLPDIIISDIMMPHMDGMSLCKEIRNDDLISHIPIILLTAKDDNESLISGYEFGADDYVTKPFELSVLKARIANLLALRAQLQKTYQKGVPVEYKKETINKFEIGFMKKIETLIHENAHKPDFNVQDLADKMFMSRTSFYRKFMSITDISPKDYITKYRINLSIELMKQGYESFGEISFICGFSSQSVYSVAFKKEKGITPLQYKKTLQ